MLKPKILLLIFLSFGFIRAQSQVDIDKANKSNTWLKIGINGAVPISDFGETHKFGLGVDASLQFLETKASGIGIKAGYLNYFAKEPNKDIQAIPLAIMYRYYPESYGWFAGLELGYAFLSGMDGTDGGIFTRFELGLHYDFWNIYGYYDRITIQEENLPNLDAIGVGITYNIRFK